MFLNPQNNSRNEKSKKKNPSDQQSLEQKHSKDIIWIGIGILIIVLIEIYTGEGFFSTSINRMLKMLETILP